MIRSTLDDLTRSALLKRDKLQDKVLGELVSKILAGEDIIKLQKYVKDNGLENGDLQSDMQPVVIHIHEEKIGNPPPENSDVDARKSQS